MRSERRGEKDERDFLRAAKRQGRKKGPVSVQCLMEKYFLAFSKFNIPHTFVVHKIYSQLDARSSALEYYFELYLKLQGKRSQF